MTLTGAQGLRWRPERGVSPLGLGGLPPLGTAEGDTPGDATHDLVFL